MKPKCIECHNNESRAAGLCSTCYSRKWRKENPERAQKYRQTYYSEHRDKTIEFAKQWNKDHAQQAKQARQRWEKKSNYYKERYKSDPQFRLKVLLRSRLLQSVQTEQKSGSAVQDLGCTIGEFKMYLETRFADGMSWENMGEWHMDHIIPLSAFDLTDREQFLRACHFTNIQPLWKEDNLKKGDTILPG